MHLLECEVNFERVILLPLNKMCRSFGLNKLINSTDVSKTKITNKTQTSPCCVSIHRIFTQEKIFGILNSKPYSDGTNQVKNNRKQNVYKHPQNVFHLHNKM